jgi:hypothetical protein
MRIRTATAAGTAAAALAGMVLAVPATAAPVRADVEREKGGRCSAASSWDLSLDKERGRIEIDVDIESRQPGERWIVKVTHNGRTVFNRTRITDDEGELDVDRTVRNKKGKDAIAFTARSAAGETCRGSLRI